MRHQHCIEHQRRHHGPCPTMPPSLFDIDIDNDNDIDNDIDLALRC
ncbi:MAG: hypothetical protein ACREMA_17160 [Longimicrobiales bacterium]